MNIDLYNNKSNLQWDQFDGIPSNYTAPGSMPHRLFTLSSRTDIANIREIHLKQAARVIFNWSLSYPELFIGLSTDSEIHLAFEKNEEGIQLFYDYNPIVIEEFQWWLERKYLDISMANTQFHLSVSSFNEIDAPRTAQNKVLWEDWALFRQILVQQAVEMQTKWLYECGFSKDRIYSHQILCSPIKQSESFEQYYGQCDVRETAITKYGVGGWTEYDLLNPYTLREINKLSGSEWGLFEWNLWGEYNYEKIFLQLKLMYQYGIHVLCPNGWIETFNSGIFIKYNDQLIQAIKDFVAIIKDKPRGYAEIQDLTIFEINYLYYQVHYEYFNNHLALLIIPFLISLSLLVGLDFYLKRRTLGVKL
jgi:hypothetical protein